MSYNQRNGPGLAKQFILFAVRIFLHNPIGILASHASRILYPRNGTNWVDVTQIELALPRLSPAFHGYRIAQISDFHFGTWLSRQRLAQAVELVNHQEPDIIAITGDYVSHHLERHYNDLFEVLSDLRARDGVVAVLGNHDHWNNPQLIRHMLSELHIRDLSNSFFTLTRGEAQLHLCGVDDLMTAMDRLDEMMSNLPAEGAAILLSHAPDFADISAGTHRFDLQISGHSHGGQLVFPVLGPLYLPGYGRKYTSGLYHINGMYQYTNRGLGTAELQVRLNCRPEITLYNLQAVSEITKDDSL
jgi:hypothetical protein